MQFIVSLAAALSLAAPALADAKYSFSCGCEDIKDAYVSDCTEVLNHIDTNANTMDPMNAIATEKVGLWSNMHVFHQYGNCKIGAASHTQPPAPGGGGGAISGTQISGQDFKDQLQAMLDECSAPNGMVNSCASVGAGNIMMWGTGDYPDQEGEQK